MTLESLPRYERARVPEIGDRAVVVGAGIAGLLTARVLADAVERVVLLERDPPPDGPVPRRGVPQGSHAHLLQRSGQAVLEDLFGGFGEALLSAGGLVIDTLSDLRHYEKGGFLATGPVRLPTYSATRPLIERTVRRRVVGEGVEIRHGIRHVDYLADDASAVTGVLVRDGAAGQRAVTADLVVDATGRTSRTPAWLANHGFESPAVDEVRIDLAYSTVTVERPDDDRRAFLVPPDPPRKRGAAVLPVEEGRWIVTLIGVHGDHPPRDAADLGEFAASLPISQPERLLDARPRVSGGVAHYPFPCSRRRRFEDLDRFPEGLIVVGDAIASFNPVYGQGMSVAALEALALHEALAEGGRAGLAPRFFDRVGALLDLPWSIAAGGDFEFPRTTGPEPRGTDLVNRYVGRLIRTAHADGRLREMLYRVFMLERPSRTLLHPGVVWRVLAPTVPRPHSDHLHTP